MAIFTVNNTNDSGTGSLRQGIEDANNTPGVDEIVFDSSLMGGLSRHYGVNCLKNYIDFLMPIRYNQVVRASCSLISFTYHHRYTENHVFSFVVVFFVV
jgi:hypothetical protein